MAKRNLVIVGNWKMNKTPDEAKKFFAEFKKLYKENEAKIVEGMKFGIAAPSIDLEVVNENKVESSMIVAAQNIHQKPNGAFTGELSAEMVKSVGANAVVLGHSERRQYFAETDETVRLKTKVALDANLLPIVCVGESLDERNAKKWKDVVKSQTLAALEGLSNEEVTKVVIAYEPIWAIGTGVTASADQAQEVCAYIREEVAKAYSSEVADKLIIQYGGSVKPDNVAELMGKEDIDGALVGGASVDAASFLKLLTLNK